MSAILRNYFCPTVSNRYIRFYLVILLGSYGISNLGGGGDWDKALTMTP